MIVAPPSNSATRPPSSVADMIASLRSGRSSRCTSIASASPRSASSERSWNSSNRTAATPSSEGSSRISRVNTPSVTTSIRVRREIFEPNRSRTPTVAPTSSPKVAAMRAAAARAASRRGSSSRIFFAAAQPSPASTSGTRVVFPAPGGAISTALHLSLKAPRRSGSAGSMGSGGSNEGIGRCAAR